MPLVKVEMIKGKPKQYKDAVIESIHSALVEAFKIKEDDRMHRVYELDEENFETTPSMSKDAIIIELTVFKGRSYEAKKLLYSSIVRNLGVSPGIKSTDIFIVINEQPLENWGIRGGKTALEVDMGFKIEV